MAHQVRDVVVTPTRLTGRGGDAVAAAGVALGSLAVAEVVLGVLLTREPLADWVRSSQAGQLVIGAGFAALALVVLRSRPRNPLGWVFLVAAHLEAGGYLAWRGAGTGSAPDGAAQTAALWIGANTWWVGLLLLWGVVPLVFPDGRLRPGWRPVAAVVAVAGTLAVTAGVGSGALVVDALPPGATADAPLGGLPSGLVVAVAAGGAVVTAVCGLAAVVALLVRLPPRGTPSRAAVICFAAAWLVVVVAPVLPLAPWTGLVADLAFPLLLGVAVLRFDLYDGGRLVSRRLVQGATATALVVAVAVLAATVGGALVGAWGGAVVAAAVVAAGLTPLHRHVRRLVDVVVLGRTADPSAVMRDLAARLADQDDADADPLAPVELSLARALRVPAVELLSAEASGAGTPGAQDVPTTGGPGGPVLRVHLRPRQRRLDPADVELLADLLPLVSLTLRVTDLLEQSRRSREQLLLAVEDERRRLRRDLHDGVGPTVAGISLGLAALVARRDRGEPVEPAALQRLEATAATCVDEVKRLVAGLRPSALDGIGLVGALHEHADALSAGGRTRFAVATEPDPFPAELPAAVELAAYRAAMEAMTNAAVHADASRCDVRLSLRDGLLELDVSDDGRGVGTVRPRTGGVGLASIEHRARELGGDLRVSTSSAGTAVRVALPVQPAVRTHRASTA